MAKFLNLAGLQRVANRINTRLRKIENRATTLEGKVSTLESSPSGTNIDVISAFNLPSTNWYNSEIIPGYPYYGFIQITQSTSVNDYIIVTLNVSDAESGMFSSIVINYGSGFIVIGAKQHPERDIVIPAIVVVHN